MLKGDISISIVISAFNRAEKLQLALNGLLGQAGVDFSKIQILVIDNNSIDDTRQIAENFKKSLQLEYSNQEKQGLGYVRDLGFRLAAGEYVNFLDEDAIPDPHWLRTLIKTIGQMNPDCVIGPIFPYYDSEKPHWFMDKYEVRSKGDLPGWLEPGEEGAGSNMTWRRNVLKELDGFALDLGMMGDVIAGGEDADLFRRYWQLVRSKGSPGKIYYAPSVIVSHWVPAYKMDVNYILKRNFAAGIAAAKMRRDQAVISKALCFGRLLAEIIFVLFSFPFTRFKYDYKEKWIVEEWRKFSFRAGWLSSLLGMNKEPRV